MTAPGVPATLFPRPRHLAFTGGTVDLRELTREVFDAWVSPEPFRCSEGYRMELSDHRRSVQVGSDLARDYAWEHLQQLRAPNPPATPAFVLEDHPTFARRGLMLDISRCKVPTMESLRELVGLARRWRFNELQLYTEHTFAYRDHRVVWRDASPMTAEDVRQLDLWCREAGIDLVPNQNCFGHFERWLRHPEYRHLAESPDGFMTPWGMWRTCGSVLRPDDTSLTFVRGLLDELLPHFSSQRVNVGCDETFELGQGHSRERCETEGHHEVYTGFVAAVVRHVNERHGRRAQMWADVALNAPECLALLPAGLTLLNWGYEANHPFERETQACAAAGLPFYVCPGTSCWNSFAGRTGNMLANVRHAARAGKAHGAEGLLITDWGDNGHLQPQEASYPAFTWAAMQAWNPDAAEESALPAVCDTLCFDTPGTAAQWMELGRSSEGLNWQPGNDAALFKFFVGQRPPAPEDAVVLREIRKRLRGMDCATEAMRLARTQLSLGAAMELRHSGQDVHLCEEERNAPQTHARLWRERNREGGLAESLGWYKAVRQTFDLSQETQ